MVCYYVQKAKMVKGEDFILKNKKEKLWTLGFFILWQSQLVSTLGDAVYNIALGFWVLSVTGSTALMGMLMASSALAGVLVSPFAGVIIDRYNRKHLLILMDTIRGISIIIISVAAINDRLAIWAVFATGIILSICGAIFRPGVNSSVPDTVPKSKLTSANSMLSIASTGSSMIGNIAGGLLFQIFGAPILFIFNGLSYFFSGTSLIFVHIPKIEKNDEQNFWINMRDGFSFMWKFKGLRYILLMVASINFFSYVAIVLFLPLFQDATYLGAGKYGIAMACFMGGSMAGYIFSSIVFISPLKKLKLIIVSTAVYNISLIVAVNQYSFIVMVILLLVGGFFNSVVNVTLLTTVQSATPQEMRGKVMAFMSMITQGLTPFAMALGGILASFISIRILITVSFITVVIIVIPFYCIKPFKKLIRYDYKTDNLKDLIHS